MSTLVLGDSFGESTETTEVKEPIEESIEGEGAQEEASTSEETQADEESGDDEVITPDDSKADDSTGNAEEEHGDEELKALEAIRIQKQELLQEISDLRRERRGLREKDDSKDLFVPKAAPADLTDIADTDVAVIQKVVEKLGYVKKEEIQKTTYQQALEANKESWLQAHPEYLPENDPDDKKWSALQSTMKELFEGYPSDPKKIAKMLTIAHKELHPTAALPVKNRATTEAAKAKIAMSSKTGGGTGAPPQKTQYSFKREHFLGTDEEYEELYG